MKKQYENNIRKGGIAEEIAILKQRREARKEKEEKKNSINPSSTKKEQDQKFLKMITQKKQNLFKTFKPLPHIDSSDSKIFVVVRKRPIFQKEINNGEIDCISIINPRAYIHECKIQIDGITKYLEEHEFYFDGTFGEDNSTSDVYDMTIAPMINLILNQGIVTCFAYGQTGSGKTYTMKGLEKEAIDDLYNESKKMGAIFDFYVSFFEIYRGMVYDLLNNKNKVEVLDDKNGKVHIYGLINQIADSPEMMHHIIDSANAIRTTHNTVTNETSSRSHAICNIVVKLKGSDEEYGKLSLVDLAGSERAVETKSNDKERRAEGAEINKSLLALKECIRALDEKKLNPDQHVPFRASKLTHVLRDSFVSKSDKSRIIMISCVMPSYRCCNHSLNTLRYADRLKEKTKHHFGGNYNNININSRGVNSNPIGNNKSPHLISKNSTANAMPSISLGSNHNTGLHKSYTKEISSKMNKLNLNNNINNNNYNSNNNNKYVKEENISTKKINNNQPSKNVVKKSLNVKKAEIPKGKNNVKYEDKFLMMKEDEIDIEKRKKFNYNIDNNENYDLNKIHTDESLKNENEEDEEEKDWKYVQKLEEKEEEQNEQGDEIYEDEKENEQMEEEEDANEDMEQIEEDIINTHMKIIREAANILSEEGDLVTNIKGVGKIQNFTIDEYIDGLEKIVDKKMDMYGDIKGKIVKYRKQKGKS